MHIYNLWHVQAAVLLHAMYKSVPETKQYSSLNLTVNMLLLAQTTKYLTYVGTNDSSGIVIFEGSNKL